MDNQHSWLEILNNSAIAHAFHTLGAKFTDIPQEIVVIETEIFKMSLIAQTEQDIRIGDYKIQLLNGNVAGIITPTVIGPQCIKDRLTNTFGTPGNGTIFDIQEILEIWKSPDGKNAVSLDFEFTSTDNGSICSLTYVMQHFTKNTDDEVLAGNFLVKIDVNISKLNIIPGSYAFTHNLNQVMEDAGQAIAHDLNIIKNKSSLAETLCGISITVSALLIADLKTGIIKWLDKGIDAAESYILDITHQLDLSGAIKKGGEVFNSLVGCVIGVAIAAGFALA